VFLVIGHFSYHIDVLNLKATELKMLGASVVENTATKNRGKYAIAAEILF